MENQEELRERKEQITQVDCRSLAETDINKIID